MTSISAHHPTSTGRGFLRELEGASPFGSIGPNWFASVMGTGIVAVALAGLPFDLPGAEPAATVMWLLSVVVLVAVIAATLVHALAHPAAARAHLDHPVMSHFYGAPAMALMTVGAGTLLVGSPVLGTGPAVAIDAVLWTSGTALGLATAVVIPWRVVGVLGVGTDSAFGAWLMPVVPPMVSSATGALLVPHLPAGPARTAMLVGCCALFVIAVLASAAMIVLVVRRLVRHGAGPAPAVPTWWIVLGPLGQSITAAHHLGVQIPGDAGRSLAVAYGGPVLVLAMVWLVVAAGLTLRTARAGLPFSLTWWSFTFPVGTVVTGVSGLAALTGLVALQVLAGVLFALLVAAWVIAATRTLAGVYSGALLTA